MSRSESPWSDPKTTAAAIGRLILGFLFGVAYTLMVGPLLLQYSIVQALGNPFFPVSGGAMFAGWWLRSRLNGPLPRATHRLFVPVLASLVVLNEAVRFGLLGAELPATSVAGEILIQIVGFLLGYSTAFFPDCARRRRRGDPVPEKEVEHDPGKSG